MAVSEKGFNLKLLFVINNLTKGGAETLLVNFLQKLKESSSLNIEILLLENIGHESNLQIIKDLEIPCHFLRDKGLYNPYKIIKALYTFIRTHNYDLIHVHLFPAMYWIAILKWTNIFTGRLIFTEHSISNRRIGKWYYKGIERIIYNCYDKVICISEAIKNKLDSWVVKHDSLVVISNGIDISPIQFRTNIFDIIELQPGDKVVLMVARFEPPKDHYTLVDAITLLEKPEIKVLLAGEGRLLDSVRKYIQEKGVIRQFNFIGVRNDIRSLMSAVDLNILSTEYEGVSGVAIEAMLSLKPFLGSNVPGVREVVGDQEGLFTYKDSVELAHKIRILLYNKEEIARNILLNTQKAVLYDINTMVKKHIDLYKTTDLLAK
jgi:glycosyltransferase involved in cell wall biosynthesis